MLSALASTTAVCLHVVYLSLEMQWLPLACPVGAVPWRTAFWGVTSVAAEQRSGVFPQFSGTGQRSFRMGVAGGAFLPRGSLDDR